MKMVHRLRVVAAKAAVLGVKLVLVRCFGPELAGGLWAAGGVLSKRLRIAVSRLTGFGVAWSDTLKAKLADRPRTPVARS